MTLSNFDWTDKTSVKWFLMLPTGHEGPYSLDQIARKNNSPELKIWAEGLSEALPLKLAMQRASEAVVELEEDIPPPLPPLPIEDEAVPDEPMEELVEESLPLAPVNDYKFRKLAGIILGSLLLIGFGLREWTSTQEHFTIRRLPKMSPQVHQKISSDFKFESWNKKIFFKEYVPMDMSHIWLVTSSFHRCKVEASFTSLKGKLLSHSDEKVSFKTTSELTGHIAEFSNFDFTSGSKIIPGLYEMDLKATQCSWDGLAARIRNFFNAPDESYVTRMKVILYSKGSVEFNSILDNLIRKKLEQELKTQNQEELFWQDLQQKLQTLLAISLQIEQLLLEFIEVPSNQFGLKLRPTVEKYTKNYGQFLTNFVVANEEYFKELENSGLSNMSKKRNYEKLVRMTSQKIGFESMKIIEELQSFKKPAKSQLQKMDLKIKTKFQELKEMINSQIIQLTEDRVT